MSNARLIGIYSPAPGSGKTTVANYLHGHGYRILPFAQSLKRMAQIFLTELGLSESEIEQFMHRDKELLIPHHNLNVSVRHICQTLGTEWGRSCIHPTVWLMCWKRKAQELLDQGMSIVVDDMRFPNEAQIIRQLGGELWRVERPASQRTTFHASEGSLDGYTFDRRIVNDSSLLDLYNQVKQRVEQLNSLAA